MTTKEMLDELQYFVLARPSMWRSVKAIRAALLDYEAARPLLDVVKKLDYLSLLDEGFVSFVDYPATQSLFAAVLAYRKEKP